MRITDRQEPHPPPWRRGAGGCRGSVVGPARPGRSREMTDRVSHLTTFGPLLDRRSVVIGLEGASS